MVDIQSIGVGVMALERELARAGLAPLVGIMVERQTGMIIKAAPDQHMLSRDPRKMTADTNYVGSIIGVPFYIAAR